MGMPGNAFQQPGLGSGMLGYGQANPQQSFGWHNPGTSGFGQGMGMGAGLGSMLGGLFGNSDFTNPMDKANPYLQQIPDMMKQYMNPYLQMGQQVMPSLQQQYQKMMSDPTGMVNQISSGYKSSHGYQFNVDQATKAANQAASAGGMVGSPQEQQQLAGTVSGLASQDYDNYMNTMLGQYNQSMNQGLQGMQGLNNMGYGAATGLSNNLANVLGSQAQLAYAGQANQNQANAAQDAGMWGGIGSLVGGLASFFI